MSVKRTASFASLSGIMVLIILTVKLNLRSIDHLITSSVFEMFSSSSAFLFPPYNGTLISTVHFFYHIHAISARCRKLYSIEGRSCHKQSDTRNELCIEDHLLPSVKNCLIYSIGNEEELPFEDNLHMAFECQTHMFDQREKHVDFDHSKEVTYHPIGKGNGIINATALKGYLRKLKESHPKIDVMKLDLWGQEWEVLEILLEENIIENVQQLTFSSHLDRLKKINVEKWIPMLQKYLDMLLEIEERGLKKVFYSESKNTLTSVLVPSEVIPRSTCGNFLYIRS